MQVEQTQFKIDIVNKIKELKLMQENSVKKCEDTLKRMNRMKQEDKAKKVSEITADYRRKLDELMNEIDLRVEPEKKIKTGEPGNQLEPEPASEEQLNPEN